MQPVPARSDGYVARVGVLGGGQLARMLAIAGAPLGVRVVTLTPDPEASHDVTHTIAGEYDDEHALRELASLSNVVTYEFENIPPEAVERLEGRVLLRPPPAALTTAADRWAEKELFGRLGIPIARYTRVAAPTDFDRALTEVGLPCVVKTRRMGYDGKGQRVCRTEEELRASWDALGGVDLLCEQWVPFERELSIVAVRSIAGDVRCYAPGENVHEAGILRSTIAPAPDLSEDLHDHASLNVRRILAELDYVGVLALEMFQHGDTLLANEIAPRVHNTGHWTIEGAETSQFENHLRAVLGWPLGSTRHHGHAAMVNIIGTTPPLERLLAIAGLRVHMYGKQPRPGRKLGHVNIVAASGADAREHVAALRTLVEG
jgi:5-(carboxyamino)imidazole ribonucleotide synthase